MKIAALQMVSGSNVQDNLQHAHVLLSQAAQAGAELVVLPEYFCLMGHSDSDKLAIQETPGRGPLQQFLASEAHDLNLWLVGGTVPLAAPRPTFGALQQRVFNSTLVYSPEGACVARYDKIHLFRFDSGDESYDESRVLFGGAQPATFDINSKDGHCWRVGLSVCYDLRFPELYRHYASVGAHLLLVPSAFTFTTGQAHWEPLLRARAIENLAYVAAAAQGGLHDNQRQTWGHSMLIDPWGKLLEQLSEQRSGLVVADIDFAYLTACRGRLPALQHRVL
jgi:nitrilase